MDDLSNMLLMNWGWLVYAAVQIFCVAFIIVKERNHKNKLVLWVVFTLIFSILAFWVYMLIGISVKPSTRFKEGDFENRTSAHVEDAAKASGKPSPEFENIIKKIGEINGPSYSRGDEVEIFSDGKKFYESYFEDLKRASKFIHIEMFIIRDDYYGKEFFNILMDRVRNGVEVLVIGDCFGIGKGPFRKINEFVKTGGKIMEFHGLETIGLSSRLNFRNHRKFTVIDGETAYCGGFNIGVEHTGQSYLGYWRDTTVKMKGNSISSFESIFITDWEYVTGRKMDNPDKYFPEPSEPSSGCEAQIVTGGPENKGMNGIRNQYVEMIRATEKEILIHTPYLVPDEDFVGEIKKKLDEGVEVKIVIPDKSDHPLVFWNSLYCANWLMGLGAKVFLYHRGFVHSKTLVSDGRISSIGSANIDDRSMLLNFECDVMLYSEEVGKMMTDIFYNDLRDCTEFSVEQYNEICKSKGKTISFSRLFKNFG